MHELSDFNNFPAVICNFLGEYILIYWQERVLLRLGVWRMHWPKTGTAPYHATLRLPDKGLTFKGMVVSNS